MGLEVCYSETGRKLPAHVPDECRMVFVCAEFGGPDYERLVEKKFRYCYNGVATVCWLVLNVECSAGQ